jgi:hypothetical protein
VDRAELEHGQEEEDDDDESRRRHGRGRGAARRSGSGGVWRRLLDLFYEFAGNPCGMGSIAAPTGMETHAANSAGPEERGAAAAESVEADPGPWRRFQFRRALVGHYSLPILIVVVVDFFEIYLIIRFI